VSEGTKEVRVTTKTSDALPHFIRGTKGLYKISRTYPEPAGYLEQVDAEKVDEEYIKKKWGGGKFELTWFPPPEATDREPMTFDVEINAPPRGYGHGQQPQQRASAHPGTDPALLALLSNLNSKLDAKENERTQAMDGEWMKLLATQREQATSMMTEVVGLMGTFHQHQLQLSQEAARDRDVRHEQSLERERAFFQQTLQMQDQSFQRNQPIPKGIEQLDDLVKLVEVAGQLGGGNSKGDESLAQTVVKALPGVMDGLASGYERAATAAAELRQRRRSGRALPPAQAQAFGLDDQVAPPQPIPSPTGFGAPPPLAPVPAPQTTFGPPAGAQPPPPVAEQPQQDGELPEGADPQWMESDEGHEFVSWLDFMESKAPEDWYAIIQANYPAGLPAALVEPLTQALAGNGEPLLQLFTRAGALDLLQVALKAFGYDGAGTSQPMEPASGNDAPVGVEEGDVDPQAGQEPDSEPESHHPPIPDPSGSALDGDSDSEDLPGP